MRTAPSATVPNANALRRLAVDKESKERVGLLTIRLSNESIAPRFLHPSAANLKFRS